MTVTMTMGTAMTMAYSDDDNGDDGDDDECKHDDDANVGRWQ